MWIARRVRSGVWRSSVGCLVLRCVVFCFFCFCWKNQFFHTMKFTKIMQRHKKGYLHGLWVRNPSDLDGFFMILDCWLFFGNYWILRMSSFEMLGMSIQYFWWVDRPHGLNKIWGVRVVCCFFPRNLWCWASWAVKLVEGTNWKSWHATPHLHP